MTKTQPRLLPAGGGLALVETLATRVQDLRVTFFYETTVESLDQDEDGQVVGLRAVTNGGRVRFKDRVMLACGGFEGNSEMQTRCLGPRAEYFRPICKGAYSNRGEGIQMAIATVGDFGSFHAERIISE